jgi:hypothetical protein
MVHRLDQDPFLHIRTGDMVTLNANEGLVEVT